MRYIPRLRQSGSAVAESSTTSRKFIPSEEQQRQMARESRSGGRTFCDKCGLAFEASYVRPVRLSVFKSGNACRDCIRKFGLTQE